VQDVIPLRIHRGNHVVSGEAWRLYKEANLKRKFSDFWLECCQYSSMCSFQLSWFFLQRDGYTLANKASSSQAFVKTEPLSNITNDCNFAYASDTAKNGGRNPGHIVELSFCSFSSSKLCNITLVKFLYGNKAINSFLRKMSPFPPYHFSCKNFVDVRRLIIDF
jgi:hypothetical protein